MLVAVTGGTGFIGRRLVLRHLEAGDTVRLLTRRPLESVDLPKAVRLFRGDLTRGSGSLRPFVEGADILYHCAAELRSEPLMKRVHVDGTRSLLQAAHGRVDRCVFLSSIGVYGPVMDGTLDEDTPFAPVGEYEATKSESELLAASEGARGLPLTILRPSTVFGLDMRATVLRRLSTLVRQGLFFFIGPPGACANFIAVEDVVEALILCGSRREGLGKTYNVSDQMRMEEFIAVIAAELGVSPPKHRLPLGLARALASTLGRFPGFPLTHRRIDALTTRAVYGTGRIRSELGWSPAASLEERLRKTLRAWRNGNS